MYWITIQCCFQELMFLQLLNCSKLALLTHFNDVYLEKKTHIGYWTKLIFPTLGNPISISDVFFFLIIAAFRLGSNRQPPILYD